MPTESVVNGPMASSDRAALAEHGYVEEEWFIDGTADAFDPDGLRIAVGVPFATRFLVRRPNDREASSGTVFLDPLHMIGEAPASWTCSDWLMRSGHVWVGVTVHNSSFGSLYGYVGGIDAVKAKDPDRYESRHLESLARPPRLRSYLGPSATDSFALKWYMAMAHPQGHPIVAEVARQLRDNPQCSSLGVKRVYGCGYSQTANFWRLFLDGGFHDRARNAYGVAPFDAYVLIASPPPQHRPVDAVLVNILTEAEVVGTIVQTEAVATADCDQPRARGIELPGAPHTIDGKERADGTDGHRHSCEPYGPFISATLANLDGWVRADVPMPHVARIARDPRSIDGIVRDRFGNAVGGLRVPWLEAPRAQYLPRCACSPTIGEAVMLDRTTLEQLYPTDRDHETRWNAAVDRLVEERLLLAEDAADVRGARPADTV